MRNPDALPSLPRDEGGPVFAEPWQAHAFALAVKLSETGLFTWSEWAQALGAELAAANARGEPDDGSRYYHYWLAALERLVAAKNILGPATMLSRKEEWAAAYRRTPHGHPVTLRHAEAAPASSSSCRPLPNPPPLAGARTVGIGGEKEGPESAGG
jgi:nitrile hydratase accessory protein